MKKWINCEIVELDVTETANKGNKGNNGNNDTHEHTGWCEMHKHPENGICTCGRSFSSAS